ncbi:MULTISPECIES: ABC transporter permease subunit [Rhodobacterales]|jgi:branched-chain amino acid transport system permease protein|uniref:Branched-chain amino acid ABC transporter permease n=1 Tax=Phaeobacter gallaeciensis TaxID=60890 RepID=A0A1B0ZMX1_9RHOB|nr:MULTISPECIES: urea ABC transporter [Phaeobacter]MDF1774302.1 branched-chain amino acid ABC transporter permease [Pseudophaeobacter sp. bin_em_oilr2.035]MEE2634823.1 branched-chain amino acid ABC transporter permease [Pseudomonadota bacterium]ANP35507.1 urea ABC transporter [Phaeobacter gallaeciensis]MDE4063530.1 branched-chain amino acid ABC transporter permease [Phaeobacter gallaeciensis]MDE4126555.1 branched-chain amino acid ABC transporter permease [Phaeobacter gallaeciensis]
MDLTVVILVEMLYAVASLILISAGLAVVFGMMKVINLAHGEFMMMGGYATITAVNLGVNIFIAMLVIAPIVVGLIGLVVERLVIRHLYGRLVDTMLATWGLSLFFIGLATMIFGNTTTGISTPIPGFAIGNYQVNGYNFFIIVVAILLLIGTLTILKATRAGLIARGTMQRSDMAAALGYSPDRIYMATFFCGSALSGLAGAVLAPLVGLVPTSGGAYIAKAFITVIAGGPSLIAGLFSSAGLFGVVNQVFTFAVSPVIGEVALLVAAVILLRLLPQGITGKFFKGKL